MDMLTQVLDQVCLGEYDFVYFPYGKRKARNIALAFINFTEHRAAVRAAAFLSADQTFGERRPQVSQAHVQGLGPNLAYFFARFGFQELDDPHAPRVYEGGVRVIDLMQVVSQYVSMDMVCKAQELLQVESSGVVAKDGRRRRARKEDSKSGEQFRGEPMYLDTRSRCQEKPEATACRMVAGSATSTSTGSRDDSPDDEKMSSPSEASERSAVAEIVVEGPRVLALPGTLTSGCEYAAYQDVSQERSSCTQWQRSDVSMVL
ncbi:unnamed protein product [Effrenium voratum]|uniref:Uncharacterized protein n=1 Tax=Effrenium voratum TaxID=2562239 RepID=A0AA36JMI3_9DINO|nr:unnamed protein product [Effrenium voratum]